MWEPLQATSDKDINGLVLLASAVAAFLASAYPGDRVRPLWWKGYRPRVRPTWEPKGTKRYSALEKRAPFLCSHLHQGERRGESP